MNYENTGYSGFKFGCGTGLGFVFAFVLLIILSIIAVLACGGGFASIVIPEVNKVREKALLEHKVNQEENKYWTKEYKPKWTNILPKEVIEIWQGYMSAEDPLYTKLLCNKSKVEVHINRRKWRKLNKFQAKNQLMLIALLPYHKSNNIEYIDENNEILAKFHSDIPANQIDIVHP